MGVLFSDKSGTFAIAQEVLEADDFNDAVHGRISKALKRNKAFDALSRLAAMMTREFHSKILRLHCRTHLLPFKVPKKLGRHMHEHSLSGLSTGG